MTPSLGRTIKDPSDVVDYTIDWSDLLDGDTISTSTWTAEDGITASDASKSTTATTIWISGGTAGTDYTVTNTITTAGGVTLERSFLLRVRER